MHTHSLQHISIVTAMLLYLLGRTELGNQAYKYGSRDYALKIKYNYLVVLTIRSTCVY